MFGFDQVIIGLKNKQRYRRKLWQEKVFIILTGGSSFIPTRAPWFSIFGEKRLHYYPHIDICLPEGIMPFVPTQDDMIAEDWEEVGGVPATVYTPDSTEFDSRGRYIGLKNIRSTFRLEIKYASNKQALNEASKLVESMQSDDVLIAAAHGRDALMESLAKVAVENITVHEIGFTAVNKLEPENVRKLMDFLNVNKETNNFFMQSVADFDMDATEIMVTVITENFNLYG